MSPPRIIKLNNDYLCLQHFAGEDKITRVSFVREHDTNDDNPLPWNSDYVLEEIRYPRNKRVPFFPVRGEAKNRYVLLVVMSKYRLLYKQKPLGAFEEDRNFHFTPLSLK